MISSYFLLLIFSLILFWFETILWFLFFEMCSSVFYGPECALSCQMVHVSLKFCCYWIKYFIMSLRTSWLVVILTSTISLFIFCLLDLLIIERGMLKSPSGFVYFSLLFYQFLPHVLWCCVIRCIHIKDCDIFLKNRSLYHYAMLHFISNNFLFWSFEVIPLSCQHYYID